MKKRFQIILSILMLSLAIHAQVYNSIPKSSDVYNDGQSCLIEANLPRCQFPRNTGCRIMQDAITFTGEIKDTVNEIGNDYFSIDPSKIGFKKHEITGDSIALQNGRLFYQWGFGQGSGEFPNVWIPFDLGCSIVGFDLQRNTPLASVPDFITVDFFYLQMQDPPCQGATYAGSVIWRKKDRKTPRTFKHAKHRF